MTSHSIFQKWLRGFLGAVLLFPVFALSAQNTAPAPAKQNQELCGSKLTPAEYEEHRATVKSFRAARAQRRASGAESNPPTLYAPVVFHLVQNTDGEGPTIDQASASLHWANQKFASADIRFFQCSPPRIVVSNIWYGRELCFRNTEGDCEPSRSWESEFDDTYGVPNVINIYVLDTDGYSWYRGGGRDYLVFSRGHIDNDPAWILTHELGHYFGLPHTFEGDDDPETRENVTRSEANPCYNCDEAGDGFCDTDADYHHQSNWSPGCLADLMLDECFLALHPDGLNLMSYSNGNCPHEGKYFSPQQREHMYDHFVERRSYLNCNSDCQIGFNLSGIQSSTRTYRTTGDIFSNALVLPNIQVYYQAEGRILLTPGFQAVPGVVGIFRAYIANCVDNAAAPNDRTSPPASEKTLASRTFESGVSVAPNPFSGSTEISYTLSEAGEVSARVFSVTGKVVAQPIAAERREAGQHRFTFGAGALPDGVYLLVLTANGERATKRLVLAEAGN